MTEVVREPLRHRLNRWRTDPRVQSWMILMIGVATAVAVAFSGQAYYKATQVAAQREAKLAEARAIQISVEQSAKDIRSEVCDFYLYQSLPDPPPSTARGAELLRQAQKKFREKHCDEPGPGPDFVPSPTRTGSAP